MVRVSCLSVSLKPRVDTDTQVAFPGSWLVKFRNKREKDRRKKEEEKKNPLAGRKASVSKES